MARGGASVWWQSPAPGIYGGWGRVGKEIGAELRKRGRLAEGPGEGTVQISHTQPYPGPGHAPTWERRAAIQLIYTMVEGPCPPDWVPIINGMEGVLTPSRWSRDILRKAGVEVPIWKAGHGVRTEDFPLLERDEGRPWTFLWQGTTPKDRKRGLLVERIFRELALPDAKLVKKWVPFDGSMGGHLTSGAIEDWSAYVPQREMLELLARCDVSVNPTMAEGFGLVPLEHAATGMLPMVTSGTGCDEYLRPRDLRACCAYQIESTPHEDGAQRLANRDHLAELMRWTYENQDEARRMGRHAAEVVRTYWTWSRVADQVEGAVEEATR